MLFEDKILYEIKKENFKRMRSEEVFRLCKEMSRIEKEMLREGHSRKSINNVCRSLIHESEESFKNQLINENVFSDFLYGTLEHIAPGIQSYLKLQLIRFIFKKLGIDTSSRLAGFFINALKNVKFTELFTYFKEGKCPLIIESLMGTVTDSIIEYVIEELGKAVPAEGAEEIQAAADDASYIEMAGRKLIDAGMPTGFLRFFAGAAEELGGAGVMLSIVEENIKKYLLPPLIISFSKIICKDLSYQEIEKTIVDANKSVTAKEAEKQLAQEKE